MAHAVGWGSSRDARQPTARRQQTVGLLIRTLLSFPSMRPGPDLCFACPVSFDDDWANDAAHKEASARDRDLRARQERWAELDRAEMQGSGNAAKRVQRARRSERWRKTWPWLLFFAVAALLIGGSQLLGLG